MSAQWPTAHLGDLLVRSQEVAELLPDAEYREVTVRLWGNGVVERGRIMGAEVAGSRRFVASAGQFIASRIDARNGAMGIVPMELDGSVVTNDFPLFNINSDRLLPAFFGWLCRTRGFVELCQRASEGTTNRVRLKEGRFLSLQIPLPPLAEQRRVVTRLEELAAQIHEARTLRQESTREAEAIWGCGASEILDRAVEIYPVVPLADLVTIRGGGTPSKADPFYWEGTIPWITPKDMKHRELSDAIDHISERAVRETSAKLIDPGAVLVVVRGMILAHTFPSAILRSPAAINQDMKALVPSQELLPVFLCSLFWAYNSRILELVEKSTHDTRRLDTGKLLNTKIIVPPIPQQWQIVAELDTLRAEVDALQRLQGETAAQFDALLPSILDKAFKGEL